MLGRTSAWSEGDELLPDSGGDVPPRTLADPDSHFMDIAGLTVHYKEASSTAVSLAALPLFRSCASAAQYFDNRIEPPLKLRSAHFTAH